MSTSQRLGIAGGGRAAWAFGSALRAAGWPIAGVWLRAESTSRLPELLGAPRLSLADLTRGAETMLIAVSDRAIGEVFDLLRPHLRAGALVFHASGAMTSAILSGAPLAFSLHPLRALPPAGDAVDLRDTLFVFEGDSGARPAAESIVNAVGGRIADVNREQKILYHAAAVFGSNYVAVLLEIAQSMLAEAGIRSELREDLAELAVSAIENWKRNDGFARFTGPVARGDGELVERHLAALAGAPNRQEVYRRLALELATTIARQRPEMEELARRIERLAAKPF